MNIMEEIKLNPENPSVLSVQKTDKINLLAVGLGKKQMLKKHQTHIPTLLIVLKGFIEFHIQNKILKLKAYDTFHIPVNTEHEVIGMEEENIFTLMQEK